MSDHKISQGDDRVITYLVIDDETGQPMIFPEGTTATWLMAKAANYPPVVRKTELAGITLSSPGTVHVNLDSTDSSAPIGIYQYRMKITRANKQDTIRSGQITILPGFEGETDTSGILPIIRGQIFSATAVITDENGDAIPITGGRTVVSWIATSSGTIPITVTVTNALAGTVLLELTDEETELVPLGLNSTFYIDVRNSSGGVEIRDSCPVRGE